MHMQGTPKSMQDNPKYEDVVEEIKEFFKERIEYALSKGVSKKQIILDPGIGFGKTLEHNRTILRNIRAFKNLSHPVMIGASRKSFIGAILNVPPEERLEGSLAVAVFAASQGAEIIRTHDVAETARALKVTDAIVRGRVK
jgi:dihydropteroate synthase